MALFKERPHGLWESMQSNKRNRVRKLAVLVVGTDHCSSDSDT